MQTANKKIAQNTIYLYLRMLATLIVGLYTSRIVLQTLGVEDYGIYNVVGGVVIMFSFINNSMGTVTQRFITYALGKDDKEYLKYVFSTSVTIFFIIAILIIILAETLGLWFFYHKMQIPTERINIAFWVYQFSILSLVIGMFLIPYNSTIIGHEKMSIFAYFSIIEVTLKLAIVFALVLFPIDKLFLYSILIVAIQLFMFSCYQIYCKKHFVAV